MTAISRSKGTARFAFRESNAKLQNSKQKPSLIILNFAYGNTRFRYSTGYKSCYADWDFKKQRVKNKASITNKDEVNDFLSGLEKFINSKYSELTKEQGDVSKDVLKYHLDVYTKKIKPNEEFNKNLSFFEAIQKFIDLKDGQISDVTLRSYKQTQKRLKEYERYYNTRLIFQAIDMSFYNKFTKFMEVNNYSLNTIGKHIKTLKTFLNYAVSEGYSTNQKYKSNDFKVKKEITTEIYLTDQEIKQMFEKDLSKYPELEHARDVFLMGCYTGQRISDYNGLKEDDIVKIDGVQFFEIKQKKNRKYGRVVHCPITKEMKTIMKSRYNGKPPKKIHEQDLNENIKQVGQMLEWNDLIKCEYTKGGIHHSKMIPKYDLIKSHTARRSFCTNKYKAGMSVFDIMLFSGHTTEKEFYKYIRIKEQERASHIVKSGFFNI
ncbi:MAG: site-specific integrase [Winogradskyella sp.]|uniref:tyrosine-type recombinase/integrase n=1 Tax=Winogradskyella sp. TaxID=1883156 RepID=UPI0017B28AB3|nr:site-specific integrase [Winogradskyella sp.]MBT8244930.1 site-specific integrase [Winogradskyella sp.]NNK23270.1 site-specific integrase [Winogradskyella sp.]